MEHTFRKLRCLQTYARGLRARELEFPQIAGDLMEIVVVDDKVAVVEQALVIDSSPVVVENACYRSLSTITFRSLLSSHRHRPFLYSDCRDEFVAITISVQEPL